MAANTTAWDSSFLQAPLQTISMEPRALLYALVSLAIGSILIVKSLGAKSARTTLPYISKDKKEFNINAKQLIVEGFKKFSGPFNVVTPKGPLLVLPPDYIDAVNAEPALSFQAFSREEFLADLDTFQSFRPTHNGLFEDAVMKGLTRSLPKFTKPLSDQMSACLAETWGENPEWHATNPRIDILDWVAHLSTRIFLGEELTSNKEWLKLSVDYTVNSFQALDELKLEYPKWLIPIAAQFTSKCKQVRADQAAARSILRPIIARRYEEIRAAEQEGRKPNLPDDAIDWFRTAAKGRKFDEEIIQMGLAVAAIHTTSDLLTQALLNLASHPEMIEPLREEITRVLGKFGWKKVALTELRLLDSFFKETQRMKPVGMTSMHRLATADVVLPGGLKILKGETLAISAHRMWSEESYEKPDAFDGYRFFNLRKTPGLENRSLLVSTSNEHLGFSHGKHACPGRFFAANEVKIAFIHLIMKYDIKLDDKDSAKWIELGVTMLASFSVSLDVKRRKEEIDLDTLAVD